MLLSRVCGVETRAEQRVRGVVERGMGLPVALSVALVVTRDLVEKAPTVEATTRATLGVAALSFPRVTVGCWALMTIQNLDSRLASVSWPEELEAIVLWVAREAALVVLFAIASEWAALSIAPSVY